MAVLTRCSHAHLTTADGNKGQVFEAIADYLGPSCSPYTHTHLVHPKHSEAKCDSVIGYEWSVWWWEVFRTKTKSHFLKAMWSPVAWFRAFCAIYFARSGASGRPSIGWFPRTLGWHGGNGFSHYLRHCCQVRVLWRQAFLRFAYYGLDSVGMVDC